MSEDQMKEIFERLKDHESRLKTLEESLRGPEKHTRKIATSNSYSGASGGIRLLIDEDFFKAKRGLAEIKNALENKGYHYSRQAVHAALKLPSKPGGALVTLKEKGGRMYVERK